MMKLKGIDKLRLRAQFADWWYLRTNTLLTTTQGEAAFRHFLSGKRVSVRDKWAKLVATQTMLSRP